VEPDDLQFRNWKQTVEESLARSAVLLEQFSASNRRMDRFERYLARLERLCLKTRPRSCGQLAEHQIRMNSVEMTLAEIADELKRLLRQHPG